MIVLTDPILKDNGKTVFYDFRITPEIVKFFSKEKFFVTYEIDVSKVPKSILNIPVLANLLPMSWFLDFQICVDELDENFKESVELIKLEFQKMYPQFILKGGLQVEKVVPNRVGKSGRKAMLFSGGVDAISAYIRHYKDDLSLFSIRGADIDLKDDDRWNDLINYNSSQAYLKNNAKYTIASNLRTFYSYNLEKELNIGWWGKVQHGMALLGVTAPLTNILNIENLYIGSTHTKETQISWGSNPTTDELLKWSDVKITHECYDLSRQQKIRSILDFCKENNKSIGLRVCYSERREELNCSVCEKCLRTIMGIVLEGYDPNDFGFKVDSNFYSLVEDLLHSKVITEGVLNHWKILKAKATEKKDFFVFENKSEEVKKIRAFSNFPLELMIPKSGYSKLERRKFIIINKYPRLFKFYLKLRLKFVR